MEKRLAEKQSALEGQSFKYLDIFDKQMREHKQAQKEFYEAKQREEEEAEKNKPAFFQSKGKSKLQAEPSSSD